MISLSRRFQDVCLPIPSQYPSLPFFTVPLYFFDGGHLPSPTPPSHKHIPLPPHSSPQTNLSCPGYIGKQATPTTNPEPIQSPVVPPSSTSTTAAAADLSTQLQRTSISSSAKTSPPPLRTPTERSPAPPPPYGLAQAEVLSFAG